MTIAAAKIARAAKRASDLKGPGSPGPFSLSLGNLLIAIVQAWTLAYQ